jgi:methylated-DNA-[protein]-cysteine S-methyltransferase
MITSGFTLFNTAIGFCAIAWSERGIAGVQLPEASERDTRGRMALRYPNARETDPPAHIRRVIDAIVALLDGEPRDLATIVLDMEGVPPFHVRVYEAARTIPPGRTLAYGDLARRLGAAHSARAVGQALARNPFAIIVPCHRVLSAQGRIGGFSANGGIATKRRLLAIEGGHAETARASDGSLPLLHDGGAVR